ncbi:MAG TPA: hypothetical protein GXX56_05205 [Rhodocyclaceae bacterium]|nr:hypothetical protein [Rhodocyclaceae bacterium]
MKKQIKIYLLLSATLIAVTAVEFLLLFHMGGMLSFFLFPLAWSCLVITALYVFGTPGVWLFEATVGKLIEKIERK